MSQDRETLEWVIKEQEVHVVKCGFAGVGSKLGHLMGGNGKSSGPMYDRGLIAVSDGGFHDAFHGSLAAVKPSKDESSTKKEPIPPSEVFPETIGSVRTCPHGFKPSAL